MATTKKAAKKTSTKTSKSTKAAKAPAPLPMARLQFTRNRVAIGPVRTAPPGANDLTLLAS